MFARPRRVRVVSLAEKGQVSWVGVVLELEANVTSEEFWGIRSGDGGLRAVGEEVNENDSKTSRVSSDIRL